MIYRLAAVLCRYLAALVGSHPGMGKSRPVV
jgi:hypothetical protein